MTHPHLARASAISVAHLLLPRPVIKSKKMCGALYGRECYVVPSHARALDERLRIFKGTVLIAGRVHEQRRRLSFCDEVDRRVV